MLGPETAAVVGGLGPQPQPPASVGLHHCCTNSTAFPSRFLREGGLWLFIYSLAGGSLPGWDSQTLENDKESLRHQTPAGLPVSVLPSWRNVLPCGEAVSGSEWPCISGDAKWLPSLAA